MPRNLKRAAAEQIEKIEFDAVQYPLFPILQKTGLPQLQLFRLQTQMAEATHEITDVLP